MSGIDLLKPPDDRAVNAALEAFSEAIRRRYGTKLAGVHLFGSRARGDFEPLSDVDVAVVLIRAESKTLDEQIALYDLAYDLLLQTGAEIQPWLFEAHEWADPPHSAAGDLVRSAKRDSRTLWAPLLTPLFRKALRAAEPARLMAATGDYDGACDRAYYAMFNAARVLLQTDGILEPGETKTHAAILRRFSEVFVLSGQADPLLGRGLNLVQGLRGKADYSPLEATREEARKAIETMDQLLRFAAVHLEDKGGQGL